MKQKQARRDKQSDESSENFEKDDTFLSFAERMPAYQSNMQYNAEAQVIFFFCSPRNCTGNHMAHKSCGHFFLSTKQHCCCMLSRGDTICIIFLRGSLEKSYDAKERRKETGTFHQSCPPLEDKANMY